MKYIVIIIFLFLSSPANAGFHVGTSIIEGANKLSYDYGYSHNLSDHGYDDWVINLTTNALISNTRKEVIVSSGIPYTIKSKPLYGAFSLGKKIDRFVISGVTGFAKVRNRVYYNNLNISNDSTHGIILGGNVNYFITKNVATSVFLLLPNTNIDLERSFGFGLSWYY